MKPLDRAASAAPPTTPSRVLRLVIYGPPVDLAWRAGSIRRRTSVRGFVFLHQRARLFDQRLSVDTLALQVGDPVVVDRPRKLLPLRHLVLADGDDVVAPLDRYGPRGTVGVGLRAAHEDRELQPGIAVDHFLQIIGKRF